jgi:hypothetical protein
MSMMNVYCVDTITITKWLGNDTWGEPIAPVSVVVKGYVEWKTQLVRNLQGEQVTSSVIIYLPATIEHAAFLGRALLHEDRLTLPNQPGDRAIVAINTPKDFSHPHYEVFLA